MSQVTYCSFCDNESVEFVRRGNEWTRFCSTCDDAYQRGISHAEEDAAIAKNTIQNLTA